jgi:hypothetical protein
MLQNQYNGLIGMKRKAGEKALNAALFAGRGADRDHQGSLRFAIFLSLRRLAAFIHAFRLSAVFPAIRPDSRKYQIARLFNSIISAIAARFVSCCCLPRLGADRVPPSRNLHPSMRCSSVR